MPPRCTPSPSPTPQFWLVISWFLTGFLGRWAGRLLELPHSLGIVSFIFILIVPLISPGFGEFCVCSVSFIRNFTLGHLSWPEPSPTSASSAKQGCESKPVSTGGRLFVTFGVSDTPECNFVSCAGLPLRLSSPNSPPALCRLLSGLGTPYRKALGLLKYRLEPTSDRPEVNPPVRTGGAQGRRRGRGFELGAVVKTSRWRGPTSAFPPKRGAPACCAPVTFLFRKTLLLSGAPAPATRGQREVASIKLRF